MVQPTPRAVKRRHLADSVRIELLEDDADSFENAINRATTALTRLTIAIMGASLSLVVASLLLAADIARGH